MSATGNGVGVVLAPFLRRKIREEWILSGSILRARGAARVRGPVVGSRVAVDRGVRDRGRRGVRAARVRQPRSARRARRRARARVRALRDPLPARVGRRCRGRGGVPREGAGRLFLLALVLLFAGLSYVGTTRRTPVLAEARARPRRRRRRADCRRRAPARAPPPCPGPRAEAALGPDGLRRSAGRLSRRRLKRSLGRNSAQRRREPTDCAVDVEYRPITLDEFDAFARVGIVAFGAGAVRAGRCRSISRVGARPHPCRVRRRRDRRLGTQLLVRAHAARRRDRSGRRRELDRGAALAPTPRCAARDDGRARRRCGRARRGGLDPHRVGGRDLRPVRLRRRDLAHAPPRRARARARSRHPRDDDGRIRYRRSRPRHSSSSRPSSRRVRALRPGMVSRPDAWWEESLFNFAPPTRRASSSLHEDADGTLDGFIIYEISGDFSLGINRKHACTSSTSSRSRRTVRALLWQFAFSVDLVETVSAAPDRDRRSAAVPARRPAPLARRRGERPPLGPDRRHRARARGAPLRDHRPRRARGPRRTDRDTRRARRWRPTARSADTTTAAPDLVLGLSQLGSIYLGGVRAEQHAAAGTVDEHARRARSRGSTRCSRRTRARSSRTWF